MPSDDSLDKYDKFMMPDDIEFTSPVCHKCKHWNGDLTCKAFPDGVPRGVILGMIDHTKPVKGDSGIRFEQKPN